MNWLFLKVSSSLCYSNSLSLFFSLYFFRSSSHGVSPPLYSPHQFILIVHLFIIQPCTQVFVLLSSFSGFLWAVVVENTVQRYFHVLIHSLHLWSLSSLLERPGSLLKSSRSSLDWHSSGPRRITISDQYLWTFPCTATPYGAFSNVYSSSDVFLSINGA